MQNDYWIFKTEDLQKGNYYENIWKKYRKVDYIKNIVENKKDLSFNNFVLNLCKQIEKIINCKLFGIDLLLDYNNRVISIIDLNALPGYFIKEPNYDNAVEFRKFFIDNYYKKNNL